MSEPDHFRTIEVTTVRRYLIPMATRKKSMINGWRLSQVIKDWFYDTPLHMSHVTRDTHNIHRASRYCHRFAFLPGGDGPQFQQPVALWLPIHRAKQDPRAVPAGRLQIRSQSLADGYSLEAHVPASALTGFDPVEHPRLGFCYAVIDRELGWQTFTVGPEFPLTEDPSLWGTLILESGG